MHRVDAAYLVHFVVCICVSVYLCMVGPEKTVGPIEMTLGDRIAWAQVTVY